MAMDTRTITPAGPRVSIRKEVLEGQFVALLDLLRPKAGFVQLFRAIVRDVWNERKANAGRLRIGLENRLRALRQQETLLERAFLFENKIDDVTYERQRDRIRQDVTLSELELEDAKLDQLDVEGLLGFAEHVLVNASSCG
jgi:hypothetical protein